MGSIGDNGAGFDKDEGDMAFIMLVLMTFI